MLAIFRCPDCGERLELDAGGRCAGCGAARRADGVLDFVTDPARLEERAFYEAVYATRRPAAARRRSIDELEDRWTDRAQVVNRAMWEAVGDVRGRRVLLLGNGGGVKELFLLTKDPELLIVSDLAPAGVAMLRDGFALDGHRDRVCFAAIDGLAMPVFDESIDVVYGNAFVHHLPDREAFLREVARVLRPGGRAVFMDDAYSPVWQAAKRTVLRPLMRYSHRKVPRSPEDLEETLRGGFREADLREEAHRAGLTLSSRRLSLLFYLWHRASLRLLPGRLRRWRLDPRVAGPLISADEWLARRRRVRRHLVRLVWTVEKPGA